MIPKPTKIFKNGIFSKSPKKNYATNKTNVYHTDDTLSLVILDIKGFGQ